MVATALGTALVSSPGSLHRPATGGRPAARRAVGVAAVTRRADRKQVAAVSAGLLAERDVHGVGARGASSDWTTRSNRGTTAPTGSLCRSAGRSRGSGGLCRALTPRLARCQRYPNELRPASPEAVDAATAVDANYRAHSSLQNRADAVSHSDHSHHPLLQEEQRNGSGLPTVSRKTRFQVTADTSGAAYGNPLRGRPGHAPSVPIGSALLARTDAADARGWRVYRVAPNGAVIYDRWIDYDPDRAELALAELRAAAAASPAAALHQAVERQPGHASEKAITRWLAGQQTERPSAPAKPRSRAARRRWRRALARKGGRA